MEETKETKKAKVTKKVEQSKIARVFGVILLNLYLISVAIMVAGLISHAWIGIFLRVSLRALITCTLFGYVIGRLYITANSRDFRRSTCAMVIALIIVLVIITCVSAISMKHHDWLNTIWRIPMMYGYFLGLLGGTLYLWLYNLHQEN